MIIQLVIIHQLKRLCFKVHYGFFYKINMVADRIWNAGEAVKLDVTFK